MTPANEQERTCNESQNFAKLGLFTQGLGLPPRHLRRQILVGPPHRHDAHVGPHRIQPDQRREASLVTNLPRAAGNQQPKEVR